MKTLTIQKSKKKALAYLLLSIGLLGGFICLFISDKTQYPKGKSFYWIAIILFGLTTLYFIYDYVDKTPLYILNRDGIYNGNNQIIAQWTDFFSFECKNPYQKYISPKIAILYDKAGNEALTIDFTASDISLARMEKILKLKLKQK